MNETSVAGSVLMIRPARFGANPETAASNRFQRLSLADQATASAARAEFDGAAAALAQAGIRVEVFEDDPQTHTPDAVFPNNWVSFHRDGTVCLYPMQAHNRRLERRRDILDTLRHERGYGITRIEDLSGAEQAGRYLEGTGSLVLDRVHRVAYAALSPRTHAELVRDWCRRFGYRPLPFHAAGPAGAAIYHTNVMMCIGERFAVVCLESIRDSAERGHVARQLQDTGHTIVTLSIAQMQQFAGNMLLLRAPDDTRLLAMSARAERALDAEQRALLSQSARIVSTPLDTIEDCAGGSMRCMIAELFLPHH